MRQRKKLRKLLEAQQPPRPPRGRRAQDDDELGDSQGGGRRPTSRMAAASSSNMAPVASGSGSTEQQGAAPAWRQFNFFTHETVESIHDRSSCPYALRSPHAIACLSAGQESVLVADLDGEVKQLGRDYEVARSWTAYEEGRCTHMQWAGIKGVLVTVGEEGGSSFPVLKVWNLRHRDKQTSFPQLLGSAKVAPGSRPHPVSCLALTPTLSLLALGLADGMVLLYRALDQFLADSASRGPMTLPKPKTVHSSPDPVTGLAFRVPGRTASSYFAADGSDGPPTPLAVASASSDRATHLFIVTTAKVLCLVAAGKASSGATPAALDDIGAALDCTRMTDSGDLIVARPEALYAYTPDGRGACVAYEGQKSQVTGWGRYIVMTSPPVPATASSTSATVRNFVNRSAAGGKDVGGDMLTRVVVFDLENKLVAYSRAFDEGVRAVWCEWGDVYVLSDNATLSRLAEKPRSEKLGSLFERNLYALAASVARSSGAPSAEIALIHRRHGDFLYAKGDFENAVQQYVKTIGEAQPSLIIRKFLDAQRIASLATYLQELHNQGVANADHTTLLLNCYTKLKDNERLEKFLKSHESAASSSDDSTLPFDLETAIRVCRQAGYFEHALYLAKRYGQADEYLRVQIEDREDWADAVAFIRGLKAEEAEDHLSRYGKQLLAHVPTEATDLFIDLCCGTLDRPQAAATAPDAAKASSYGFTSYLSRGNTLSPVPAAAPLPTAQTRSDEFAKKAANRRSGISPQAASAGPEEEPAAPSPISQAPLPQLRQFFAFFADHPVQFVRFLETVAQRRLGPSATNGADLDGAGLGIHTDDDDQVQEQESVWNTLLDLYLQTSSSTVDAKERAATEAKAQSLLSSSKCEPTQALIVCVTYDFVPGIVLLYERLGLVDDVVRFWIERASDSSASSPSRSEASRSAIDAVRRFGPDHPHLYVLALRFLTSSGEMLDRHRADLVEVLEKIDEGKVVPPITVVQSLAKSGVASVGTVKAYLLKQITAQRQEIDSDRGLIESYRAETAKKRAEIKELSDPDAPRIFQVTRCSACGGQLDLPAVHFMCKHSYHQSCLGPNEAECRTCALSHGLIRDIRRNNEKLADQHDLFLEEVRDSDDGFSQIAGAFSKGLMEFARNAEPS